MIYARSRIQIRWWFGAAVVLVVYGCAYTTMLNRISAVPYWDQAGYVRKSAGLVEVWEQGGIGRWNPLRYLRAQPAERGPLLMILPAMVFGKNASPRDLGRVWEFENLVLLALGVRVMSKAVGSARWVPGALCVILGGYWFLNADLNAYLVDLPGASAGLVCIGGGMLVMRRRTVSCAILLCVASLGAVLIKPQLAVLGLILVATVIMERLLYERRYAARYRKLFPWLAVFAAWAMLLTILYFSPYGRSVRQQWTLGASGYWNRDLSPPEILDTAAGVLPGWMIFAVLLILSRRFLRRKKIPHRIRPQTILLIAAFGGWLLFATQFTYAMDPRIIWTIMPACVCVGMNIICANTFRCWFATILAAVTFALAAGISAFAWPMRELPNFGFLLGPRVVAQPPLPEVGLAPIVGDISLQVGRGDVEVLIDEEFIDSGALQFAAQAECAPTKFLSGPFGDQRFDLAAHLQAGRYYLTTDAVPSWDVPLRAVANLRKVQGLIASPTSPARAAFTPIAIYHLRRPVVGFPWIEPVPGEGQSRSETVELWRMQRPLRPEEFAACKINVERSVTESP